MGRPWVPHRRKQSKQNWQHGERFGDLQAAVVPVEAVIPLRETMSLAARLSLPKVELAGPCLELLGP